MSDKEQTIDFKIARDGSWFHDGEPIRREKLAKLFSDRALWIDEDGKYWLKTPFEKYPVEVEDVPYVVVDYDVNGNGVSLRTNMDEEIELSAKSIWELRDGIPYVEVRDGLFARIGRSALYNMIEEFGEAIVINGQSFALGEKE